MIIVRAPVRISFGGGGTDLAAYYQHYDGYVISAAITRYCYIVLGERSDGMLQISSSDYHNWRSYPRGVKPELTPPLALPAAALRWFMNHERKCMHYGLELFMGSEVPPGSGLGSSSAMAVALAHALSGFCGSTLSPQQAAELACTFEIDMLHEPIGKQDQYASAFGGLNSIEFTAHETRVTPLNLSRENLMTLRSRLLLFNTGLTHNAGKILGGEREDMQHGRGDMIEHLHRMKAIAHEMHAVLLAGDFDQFGRLLDEIWHVKHGLSPLISSTQIDHYYEMARRAGASGGKLTGAGGGGFLLLYCLPDKQQAVRNVLTQTGLQEMPFEFDMAGPSVTMHTAQMTNNAV